MMAVLGMVRAHQMVWVATPTRVPARESVTLAIIIVSSAKLMESGKMQCYKGGVDNQYDQD